jgi:hypothetical protein
MSEYKKIHQPANNPDQQSGAGKGAVQLQDNRAKTVMGEYDIVQFKKKNGKQQMGMPAKAKPGKPKQESKNQRAFNAMQRYRADFFQKNNVAVHHIAEYLTAGNKLHGHASADSNSKENAATTEDANAFIGWFRKKYSDESKNPN